MREVNCYKSYSLPAYLLLSTTILVGILLLSNQVSADGTSSANAAVTVPFACTMSGTGNNSHNATISPNTYSGASGSEYENGIGKTTLTAICNDDNGFSIYAIGFTGNEYSGENHTKLVGTSTGGTIATKAYASGDTTSNWSMKLTKVTDTTQSYNPQNLTLTTGYDSWHAVPDTYTKVAEYHANTGSSATDTTLGVKLETTYAAFIAANQPADTYTGQVKYTMVHPYNEEPLQPQTTASGKICYYANASDAIGTMGCQTIGYDTTYTSAILLASNFSREGYGFAGWSTTYDYSDSTGFLGPQEYIEFTEEAYSGNNNGLSLYAHWVKSTSSIQNWSGCSSLASGAVTSLTDLRDNETYAVAKLADGNCWMIENLRLESTNSDNSTGALAQGYGTSSTYGNFSGLANAENTSFDDTYSANSLYSNDGSNDTISIGGSYSAYRMPRYNNWNHQTSSANRPQNPTTNSDTNSTTNAGMYSYGNYYTWHAAIADTTHYNSGDHGATSLCPSGWRLPIGTQSTTNMSFGKLSVELGGPADGAIADSSSVPTGTEMSIIFRSYPNNFLYAGYFNYSYTTGMSSKGYYWSSTADNWGYSNILSLSNTNVSASQSSWAKYGGASIRCITSGS